MPHFPHYLNVILKSIINHPESKNKPSIHRFILEATGRLTYLLYHAIAYQAIRARRPAGRPTE